MTEHLADDRQLLAVLDHQGRVGVSEIMKPLLRDSGPFERGLEHPSDIPGIEGRALGYGEYEAQVLPPATCLEPLLTLCGLASSEGGYRGAWQAQRVAKLVGLRCLRLVTIASCARR